KLPRAAEQAALLVDRCLNGDRPTPVTLSRASAAVVQAIVAEAAVPGDFTPRRVALSVCYFALCALGLALAGESAEDDVCRVTRAVARLAALREGVAGAVAWCLDLARALGM